MRNAIMKEFSVRIPFTGYIEVFVNAEDEAIQKAFEIGTLE